ncbi:zinc metalloprotease [Bacteroidia bacterium]|nr:zinc metalloprotease [Bacteroidia bacterium]
MNALIMTGQLILGMSMIVLLHELGHFFFAKLFHIKVDKFYLFFDAFGVKLFKFNFKGTEFGLGWLPFGGYCKINGMIDESNDKEFLKHEPKPYEYRSKPAWQRLLVISGGVIMNLITGVVIFFLIMLNSVYLPTEEVNKDGIFSSKIASELGFENGDKILSINGKNVKRFQDIANINHLISGMYVTVLRDNDTISVEVPKDTYKELVNQSMSFIEPINYKFSVDSVLPNTLAEKYGIKKGAIFLTLNEESIYSFGQFKQLLSTNINKEITITYKLNDSILSTAIMLDSSGTLGFLASNYPYKMSNYSVADAIKYSLSDAYTMITANAKGLVKIISGKEKATESLRGPIGMATIYGAQWLWVKFFYITAILSLILAFMNILPIPALDGGHLVFIMYEIITRKKPSEQFLQISQTLGMLILLAIMFFAIGNDIFQLFR